MCAGRLCFRGIAATSTVNNSLLQEIDKTGICCIRMYTQPK